MPYMDAMGSVNSPIPLKVLHHTKACGVAVRRIVDFSDVAIPATATVVIGTLIWGSDQKKATQKKLIHPAFPGPKKGALGICLFFQILWCFDKKRVLP